MGKRKVKTRAPFLQPLKTSEYIAVFGSFQEIEKGGIRNEWVKDTGFSLVSARPQISAALYYTQIKTSHFF